MGSKADFYLWNAGEQDNSSVLKEKGGPGLLAMVIFFKSRDHGGSTRSR